MFSKENIKKIGGYLLPILVLLVVACAYFYPALEGYELKQGDIVNWKGASQEIRNFREEFQEEPFWTNAMFSGMPSYQISTRYPSVLRQLKEVFWLGTPRPISFALFYGVGFYIMLCLFGLKRWSALIGAFMYMMSSYFIIIIEAGHNSKANALGAAPLIIGALYYLFKKDKLLGASLLALFAAIEMHLNHYQITYYTGIICVFFVLFEFIDALKTKTLPNFLTSLGFTAIAGVLAILPNIGPLFGTLDYGQFTTRGSTELTVDKFGNSLEAVKTTGLDKEYATSWSYGIEESLTLLIPNAKGGGSGSVIQSREDFNAYKGLEKKAIQQIYSGQSNWPQPYLNSYWGNQSFTSGPVYIGVLVFLFAVLFLVLSKNALRWPLLIASVLSLMLAWGKNFMPLTEFFLDFVPGYNKFRTVSMTLVILELCFPLMAVLFIKELLDGSVSLKDDKIRKRAFIASGSILGVLLLLLLAPGAFLSFISDAEKQALMAANGGANLLEGVKSIRVSIFKADTLRSLFFLLASLAVLWLFVKEKLKPSYFLMAVAAILVLDMWPINKRYLNNEKAQGQYAAWNKKVASEYPVPPNGADLQILNTELAQNQLQELFKQEQEDFRLNLDRPRALTPTEQAIVKAKVVGFNTHYRVLNLARNTFNDASTSFYHKSIGGYHGAKLQRYQDLVEWYFSGGINPQIINMLNTKYIIQNAEGGPQAYPNPNNFGAAWFVDSLVWAASPNEEIKALDKHDLSRVAVVNQAFETELKSKALSMGQVDLVSYKVNELEYTSQNEADGFLVFSEVYYPNGWKLFVDGVEQDIIPCNYLLRGAVIPAGKHQIKMVFKPAKVLSYASVGNIMGYVLLVLVLAVLVLRFKPQHAA